MNPLVPDPDISCPENWPENLQYARTSNYSGISAHLFRHILASPDPKSHEAFAPCIEEERAHPHLSIRILESPHLLAGQRGLFSTKIIPAGTNLGEYVGKISFGQEPDQRLLRGVRCWRVPFGPHILHISSHEVANELAFTNDFRGIAEHPNVRPTWIMHRGVYYFGYESIREIKPGEELLIDYGKTWGKKWGNI